MSNPLRRRLIRGSGCMAGAPAIAAAIVFALSSWTISLLAASDVVIPVAPIVAIILSISVFLTLPVFLAALAVNLPAVYIGSREYELVCATAIEDAELVWGFVLAALYRVRTQVVAAVLLGPLVAVFLPLPWPSGMGLGWSVSSATNSQVALFALLFGAAVPGRALWVAVAAVGLRLWWRLSAPAILGTLLLTEGLWWAGAIGFSRLTLALGWYAILPWQLTWTSIMACAPYLAALAALRVVRRWARRNVTMADNPL